MAILNGPPPPRATIRAETPGDADAIRAVLLESFSAAGMGDGSPEAALVDAIRAAPGFDSHLSLVAEVDGRIAGHLLVSPCVITRAGGVIPALALAPLAVLPGYEHSRAGTALMREGLRRCAERGHAIVIVLGHAKYYRRFGFRPASLSGIAAPWPVPDEAFQALALVPAFAAVDA